MPVSSWSPTAASNTSILTGITLDGSSMNVPLLDDALRDMAAQIAAQLGPVNFKGADLASAATTDLSTATGWYCDVTGTTTITSFGSVAAGKVYILRFASSLILTHNASTLILPGATSIYTTGGDTGIFVSLGGSAWRCLNWFSGTASATGVPVGTVQDYAGSAAPSGWLQCYGQSVSRSTYARLFAVIGTTFGSADGSSFTIPDLRGRIVAGQDDMGGVSANRLTSALNGDILGTSGGSETHLLQLAEIPSHQHTFSGNTSTTGAHQHTSAAGGAFFTGGSGGGTYAAGGGNFASQTLTSSVGDHTHTYSGTTSAVGLNSYHNNTQPTFILQKIIRT